MLALLHLASGTPLGDHPQDVQDILPDTSFDELQGMRRVALVGNHISPSGEVKADGTQVNTIWGELAWQLGGKEAFALVATADAGRSPPGKALHELLAAYAPAVILIARSTTWWRFPSVPRPSRSSSYWSWPGRWRTNSAPGRLSSGLTSVVLRQMVETRRVGELLQSCHALLVPLRDHPLLGDFIPSKLYDAMAVGRPVIVAARGEAASFVTERGFGVVVNPEDGAALADAARRSPATETTPRRLDAVGKAGCGEHARSAQAEKLWALLESLAAPLVHGHCGPGIL